MYNRMLSAPRQSFFLFGARGTGKSTWVRHEFPRAHYMDLLDESLYQRLLAAPALFAAEMRALRPGSWVVLDEVQRLPGLLDEVHRWIEAGLKFVLCGSSSRKLRHAGVNLLAGRALRKVMYPFVPEELGADFDLDAALATGLLPVVLVSEDRRASLEAYSQLYLKEEIQAEALVRNLPGFARFLPVAALFHGQSLSVASLARDAGVSRTTVNGYLEILEDTNLAFRLPAFEGGPRVRERKHPKLYWVDAGLVRAAKRSLGPVVPEERGALFEGLVAHLLRAYTEYRRISEEMYYWSPADSHRSEVDFLLRRGRHFVAIEAKASPTPDETMLRGLRIIGDLRGVVRRLLVFGGSGRYRTADGIEMLGCPQFSKLLAAGTLWEPQG